MMIAWPPDAKFFDGLFEVDTYALRRAQAGGCPRCRGRLDRADFPRKVRRIPTTWEPMFERRFSLCCSREGCRRRVTPASVRFLGRRVYAAVVVSGRKPFGVARSVDSSADPAALVGMVERRVRWDRVLPRGTGEMDAAHR